MLEIFQYTFLQRAFIAGTVIALIAPIVGIFLVVRRFSALADTLAHVSLIGIAVGILTKLNPIVWAVIASVISGLGIEKLRESKKIYGESALVLFLSGSLGISSVILSLSRGFNNSLFSYLFGSINTITLNDIYLTTGVAIIVISVITLLFSKFFLLAFDEDLATAQGLPVKTLNFVLITLAAITVSVGIQVVGVLLIGALMILPILTALQYQLSFRYTLFLGIIFSLFSVWIGLFSSFYLNIATGGSIVVINLMFFSLSLIFGKK